MPVKIFLVEDHAIVRQGVKALIETDADMLVVGEAENGAEAIGRISQALPDVVLMDLNMPVMSGIECTRALKRQYPGLKILVLSMHDYENYLIDMLEAGADGYVLKNTSRNELLFAIRMLRDNRQYISPEFAMSMLAKYRAQAGAAKKFPPAVDLTEKEQEVLELMAEGLTNVEMAHKLSTSVRTIETRRKNLLDKTGTINTATLMRYAITQGLIS